MRLTSFTYKYENRKNIVKSNVRVYFFYDCSQQKLYMRNYNKKVIFDVKFGAELELIPSSEVEFNYAIPYTLLNILFSRRDTSFYYRMFHPIEVEYDNGNKIQLDIYEFFTVQNDATFIVEVINDDEFNDGNVFSLDYFSSSEIKVKNVTILYGGDDYNTFSTQIIQEYLDKKKYIIYLKHLFSKKVRGVDEDSKDYSPSRNLLDKVKSKINKEFKIDLSISFDNINNINLLKVIEKYLSVDIKHIFEFRMNDDFIEDLKDSFETSYISKYDGIQRYIGSHIFFVVDDSESSKNEHFIDEFIFYCEYISTLDYFSNSAEADIYEFKKDYIISRTYLESLPNLFYMDLLENIQNSKFMNRYNSLLKSKTDFMEVEMQEKIVDGQKKTNRVLILIGFVTITVSIILFVIKNVF